MADNYPTNPGSGGLTFASDEVTGSPNVHYPRVKISVGPDGTAAEGATPVKYISAASTNLTSVKATAGEVYSIVATNTNAAARYLKLYNKASAPVLATDVPVQTYMIPPGSNGFVLTLPVGITFSAGIAFAMTTGVADTDTGAVAANEIILNLAYV